MEGTRLYLARAANSLADPIAGGTAWRASRGDTLSLIPLSPAVQGVTTHGLRYPLNDELLLLGPGRGLSNVMTEPVAQVDVRSGLLLAVHTPGRA